MERFNVDSLTPASLDFLESIVGVLRNVQSAATSSSSSPDVISVRVSDVVGVLRGGIGLLEELQRQRSSAQEQAAARPPPSPVAEENVVVRAESPSILSDYVPFSGGNITLEDYDLNSDAEDEIADSDDDNFERSDDLVLPNRRCYDVTVRRRRIARSPPPTGSSKKRISEQVRRAMLRHAANTGGAVARCLRETRYEYYSEAKCCVCLTNDANCTLLPCAHRSMCKRCVGRVSCCPQCRAGFVATINRCQ
ncbi:27.4 Inhibitor of apoptosis/ RING/U box [Spodoptera frugiperda ascovirus 1a]|uniref:27.4 Inhibitor of apoptosis/ RING/U box n=1 Tax=Spodoptera frugiperda ascovirus 1a TaxID=113370 RepID=Q0E527_SFAVA|nr:27.4 Inhibitor of apoptosis/ RING/U box [Spodoptera frugiperda ascovirus 1a]CAL44674.1 27.4 Inhibitor of apoptosis/ RING/U box [Spodoptera frugiperda ascovirus 1a]